MRLHRHVDSDECCVQARGPGSRRKSHLGEAGCRSANLGYQARHARVLSAIATGIRRCLNLLRNPDIMHLFRHRQSAPADSNLLQHPQTLVL